MILVLLVMLGILALALLVVGYVAYPHAERVPGLPRVGRALRRGAARLPVLHDHR